MEGGDSTTPGITVKPSPGVVGLKKTSMKEGAQCPLDNPNEMGCGSCVCLWRGRFIPMVLCCLFFPWNMARGFLTSYPVYH